MKRKTIVVAAACCGFVIASPTLRSQVVINEILIDPVGEDRGHEIIELKNVGATAVDLSGWELCTTLQYSGPGGFAGVTLAPNQLLVVHLGASGANDAANVYLPDFPLAFPPVLDGTLSNVADDMSIYDCSIAGCFAGTGADNRMVDFVQWGAAGVGPNEERHDIAADVSRPGGPLWSAATSLDFAAPTAEGQAIAFDGTNGGGGALTLGSDYIAGAPTIGLDNGACTSDLQCDDSVSCTTNQCMAGACVFTPNNALCPNDGLFCNGGESCHQTNGCTSSGNPCPAGQMCIEASDTCSACQSNSHCIDKNPCTSDSCMNGVCFFNPIAGCCQTSADCGDGNACTQDACTANQCSHMPISDCNVCTVAGDCDDDNVCTDDRCMAGACAIVNLTTSCDDGDACTFDDGCADGVCAGEQVLDCCESDDQCEDDDSCTSDECVEGSCTHLLISGCATCAVSDDCDDQNPCTDDRCADGFCESVANADPCDDQDPCTEDDVCEDDMCRGTAVDCCQSDAECADDDECTVDSCVENRCMNVRDTDCDSPTQEVPSEMDTGDDDEDRPTRSSRVCGLFGMIQLSTIFVALLGIRIGASKRRLRETTL